MTQTASKTHSESPCLETERVCDEILNERYLVKNRAERVMSWTLSEEDELVNWEGCFSSADRTALDVSPPVMRDRLRPGLGEEAMNSAVSDT